MYDATPDVLSIEMPNSLPTRLCQREPLRSMIAIAPDAMATSPIRM
jgi:hypothetical protein